MHDLNLLLVGFGHVGRAFVRLLDDRTDHLRVLGVPQPRVVGIATARRGCIFASEGLDATRAVACAERGESLTSMAGSGVRTVADAFELIGLAGPLARGGTVVVIETTPLNVHDGRPAADHIVAALVAGAHAITANKGPIACAWPRLRETARRADRQLLFEGVVMDGVPIFNLVRESLPAVSVTGLTGIVNTTTNYLLAALEEGRELSDALPEMQAAGIAEADPSLDVDGWDAAAKAAALANVLMEADLTPASVSRTGVGHLTSAQARAALNEGRRLKLVMRVRREREGVAATVAPEPVPLGAFLAGINGTMNALTVSTDRLGDITVVQHGGSLVDTAYALLSDLITLWRRLRAPTGSED